MINIHTYEGFTWKNNVVTTLSSPQLYPNAVTVHQCSKMPQIHYVLLFATLFSPWSPTPCVLNIIPLNPLLPPSPLALPHPSPLVTTSSWSLWVCYYFVPSVLCCCYTPQMREIIWHLSFSTWLTSLSIMSSSSIHVVANGRICFFLMAE